MSRGFELLTSSSQLPTTNTAYILVLLNQNILNILAAINVTLYDARHFVAP